ncbi:MAG: tRNA (5-methylaminomethyl-2-thiouridine)(34)-methyltransferase MnmD [Pseudomonadota bacterium]
MDIQWSDRGVPISNHFDDPYYSLDDGVAETTHVFLSGNDLPDRFTDGFHIAETGFGTGLNFLVALDAWRHARVPGTLHFTSFEAFPLDADTITAAHAHFPMLKPLSEEIDWSRHSASLPDAELRVIIGDARTTLPAWDGAVDAWFLDGFSPANNPELWGDDLLLAVGRHTKPGGTCATYSAAGAIRRGLDAAGFDVTRVAGFGRKRHMSIGTKP